MKKKIILLLSMLIIFAVPMMSFAKDTEVSKAEFIKAVLEAAEIETQEATESDLSDSIEANYVPYIEAAYKKDIISDYERLNSDKLITKEEAIVILVKVFGERMQVRGITEEMIEEHIQFTDTGSINPLAKPYITYAIKNQMIKNTKKSFYPLMPLNKKTSKNMIVEAKEVHEKYFTRKGLSAGKILVLVDKNLQEKETYKRSGKFDMNMTMNIEGLPAEDDFDQQVLENGINMNMTMQMDSHIENPNRVYTKQVIKSSTNGLDAENTSEVFMDESIMYQKMALTGEKWIKNDMSSLMSQIQSLQGNNSQNMYQLSGEQLEFFKDYAWFSDDEKIDSKEYYVINTEIDKETYEKFFEEYTKKIIDASLAQQQELNPLGKEDPVEIEMTKMTIQQVIEKMDVEISYKFYIDKKTMNYEKVAVTQNTYMNMDSFIQMFAAMAEEDDVDLANVKIEMVTHMEGMFEYFDFDGEVVFPEITEEDIFDLGSTMIPQN